MSQKFRTFAPNKTTKHLKIMIKLTLLSGFNAYKIETYHLSEEQHNMVVDMVKKDENWHGNYSLEEVDGETANVWIADAYSEGEEEYAEFLRNALAEMADIYTLTDHLGDFSQPIGEVAIYDC